MRVLDAGCGPGDVALLAAGMVESGHGEVVGVERLVDHDGVGPVLPGAYQRRRDVPGPGPHGEACGVHHA